MIPVVIKCVQGGSEIQMTIKPMLDYVETVKDLVSKETGYETGAFELIYKEKKFDNCVRMDTYFLEPNDTIYMVKTQM